MGFRFVDEPSGRYSFVKEQQDPKIGQPEELTFAEKYIAPLLDATGLMQGAENAGISRGGVVGRLAMGAADPGVALAQLAANATGNGEAANKRIQEVEQQYQAARKENGSEGFDPARLAGNIGMSTFMAAATPGTLPEQLGSYGKAAVQGAGYSALQPVVDGGDRYWQEKAKQAAIGAVAGPLTTLAGNAVGRIISPNASVNADVQMLREAGVRPTIGQTLGGWANTLEEKAMSLPIMGDAIAGARRRAVKDFNTAVLDTAAAPIGERAKGAGFDAVADVGGKLRQAYNKAADEVGQVNINTPAFNDKLRDVMETAASLTAPMRERFDSVVKNEVLRRMESDGTIVGKNIKNIDAELGRIAAGFKGSSTESERELGRVVQTLQNSIRDGVAEASPSYDAARKAADQGWRAFRLARNATAAAKNKEGIFTPAQFNTAIQQDAGKASVGEGRAFMQDAGQAAQNVLGNKYPDSGTPGRLLPFAIGAGFHAGTGGATTAGLLAGAAAYTPPVQNFLRYLVTQRPADAPRVANALRRIAAQGGAVTVPVAEALLR